MQFWRQKLRKAGVFNKVQWQPWKISRVQSCISHPPCTKPVFGGTSTSSRYPPAWFPAHIDLSIEPRGYTDVTSLARRDHDFPWHETRSHCPPKGRTPPREIFPGDAIVVIIILDDCAIRPARIAGKREFCTFQCETQRGSRRVTLTIIEAPAVSLFRGMENVGVRRTTALPHYRMGGINDWLWRLFLN